MQDTVKKPLGIPAGVWRRDETGYWEIFARGCCVTIEARPAYCDRGNYLAKVHVLAPPHGVPADQAGPYMDGQDGWPRYYMMLPCAMLEVSRWLAKRGLLTREQASRAMAQIHDLRPRGD